MTESNRQHVFGITYVTITPMPRCTSCVHLSIQIGVLKCEVHMGEVVLQIFRKQLWGVFRAMLCFFSVCKENTETHKGSQNCTFLSFRVLTFQKYYLYTYS